MLIHIPNMMAVTETKHACGGRQTYSAMNGVEAAVLEHPRPGWYTTKIRNQALAATIRFDKEGRTECLSLLPWGVAEDDGMGGLVPPSSSNPSMVPQGENHGRIIRCGRVEGICGLAGLTSPYLIKREDMGDLGDLAECDPDLERERRKLEIQILRNQVDLQALEREERQLSIANQKLLAGILPKAERWFDIENRRMRWDGILERDEFQELRKGRISEDRLNEIAKEMGIKVGLEKGYSSLAFFLIHLKESGILDSEWLQGALKGVSDAFFDKLGSIHPKLQDTPSVQGVPSVSGNGKSTRNRIQSARDERGNVQSQCSKLKCPE
jgi:hypothetical protein